MLAITSLNDETEVLREREPVRKTRLKWLREGLHQAEIEGKTEEPTWHKDTIAEN